MTGKVRVLFSSRDPGSVGHILVLLEAFREDSRFEVELVASGTAFNMLRRADQSPRLFITANGHDHLQIGEDPTPLLDAARRLLEEIEPNAVFVSLSSFGVGIDEALLATTQVPSFAMQDFWGDVNLSLGVPADLYFVLDEFAARITHERWEVKALPVGSPKHARYGSLDVDAMRTEARSRLGVKGDHPVVGFFGQSSRIPGHEVAFDDLARAVSSMPGQPLFLLRDHVKFQADRHAHLARLNELGVAVRDVTDEPEAEPWLAACDVAVTCFSSCGLDHAYLSAYARRPIGMMLYLLSNPDIRAFTTDICGFQRFPTAEQGLGLVVEDPASTEPLLKLALGREARVAYHAASKGLSRSLLLNCILDTVAEAVASRRSCATYGEGCVASWHLST